MRNHEHKLQVECIKWFRYAYSKFANYLFAIPNGGQRSKITAANLKREGVMAGVSDLFLAVPNGKYCGLFIELKIAPNRLTKTQKEFGERIKNAGYSFETAYSFDEFTKIINEYLNF